MALGSDREGGGGGLEGGGGVLLFLCHVDSNGLWVSLCTFLSISLPPSN